MKSYRLVKKNVHTNGDSEEITVPRSTWQTKRDLLDYSYYNVLLGCLCFDVRTSADHVKTGFREYMNLAVPISELVTGKKPETIRACRFTKLMDVLNSFWQVEMGGEATNIRFCGIMEPIRQTFNPDDSEVACA